MMAVSALVQKLVILGVVVILIAVIAVALYYDKHPAVVQCNEKSRQCIDVCFAGPGPWQ
jgi:hypothetical protein